MINIYGVTKYGQAKYGKVEGIINTIIGILIWLLHKLIKFLGG
jgi:uncharacterized protein YqgC (DUF456 family)